MNSKPFEFIKPFLPTCGSKTLLPKLWLKALFVAQFLDNAGQMESCLGYHIYLGSLCTNSDSKKKSLSKSCAQRQSSGSVRPKETESVEFSDLIINRLEFVIRRIYCINLVSTTRLQSVFYIICRSTRLSKVLLRKAVGRTLADSANGCPSSNHWNVWSHRNIAPICNLS